MRLSRRLKKFPKKMRFWRDPQKDSTKKVETVYTLSNLGYYFVRVTHGELGQKSTAVAESEAVLPQPDRRAESRVALVTDSQLVPAMRSRSICPNDARESVQGRHGVGRGDVRPRDSSERDCHARTRLLFR